MLEKNGEEGKLLPFRPKEEEFNYLEIDSKEMDEHELLIGLMALIGGHLSEEELREEFARIQEKIKSRNPNQK